MDIIEKVICLPEWHHEYLVPIPLEPDYSFMWKEMGNLKPTPSTQVVAVYVPYKELYPGHLYHKFNGVRVTIYQK
jgi:hypothetical protein